MNFSEDIIETYDLFETASLEDYIVSCIKLNDYESDLVMTYLSQVLDSECLKLDSNYNCELIQKVVSRFIQMDTHSEVYYLEEKGYEGIQLYSYRGEFYVSTTLDSFDLEYKLSKFIKFIKYEFKL